MPAEFCADCANSLVSFLQSILRSGPADIPYLRSFVRLVRSLNCESRYRAEMDGGAMVGYS
jgi:hypothetical protein